MKVFQILALMGIGGAEVSAKFLMRTTNPEQESRYKWTARGIELAKTLPAADKRDYIGNGEKAGSPLSDHFYRKGKYAEYAEYTRNFLLGKGAIELMNDAEKKADAEKRRQAEAKKREDQALENKQGAAQNKEVSLPDSGAEVEFKVGEECEVLRSDYTWSKCTVRTVEPNGDILVAITEGAQSGLTKKIPKGVHSQLRRPKTERDAAAREKAVAKLKTREKAVAKLKKDADLLDAAKKGEARYFQITNGVDPWYYADILDENHSVKRRDVTGATVFGVPVAVEEEVKCVKIDLGLRWGFFGQPVCEYVEIKDLRKCTEKEIAAIRGPYVVGQELEVWLSEKWHPCKVEYVDYDPKSWSLVRVVVLLQKRGANGAERLMVISKEDLESQIRKH